jgi:alginate O-acetyltransferase complex protein AlgI
MSLGDPTYLLFLGITVAVFYMLRDGQYRCAWLLIASYLFYFNLSSFYASVLALVTAIAYVGGLLLDPRNQARHRGVLFATTCVALLLPLIVFKYLGFLLGIAFSLAGYRLGNALPLTLVLPIGISFFTFAALGYLIDVYLEVIEPERRPLSFALFVAFFPLVTAGPIERGNGLLPQFEFHKPFSSERAFSAFRLIVLGLFLKIVCADNLQKPVDEFFAAPSGFIPIEKLFGLIHYGFYAYADFAGYSLIAIGSAALFGLNVRPNFRQPFLSTSIPEFWRNWHISLSSWVRDYLFTPIQVRSRNSPKGGTIAALMISFLVIGVWHGAAWGFILFGLMHGTLAVASNYTLKFRDNVWSFLGIPAPAVHFWRVVCTFFLVMLTFVVFRANSLADAAAIYRDLTPFPLLRNAWHVVNQVLFSPNGSNGSKVIGLQSWTWGVLGMLIVGDILARNKFTLEKFPRLVQFAAYNLGALLIMYGWISAGAGTPFLYYRF